jgi:hypothetical protein
LGTNFCVQHRDVFVLQVSSLYRLNKHRIGTLGLYLKLGIYTEICFNQGWRFCLNRFHCIYFDPLLGYAIIQRPYRISTLTHCWVMPSSRDHAGSVLWPIAGLCHHPDTMQDQYFDPLLGYAIIQTPCRISTLTHCWVMPSSRDHAGSVFML